MKNKQTSFYIVLGILCAAVLCAAGLLIGMGRNGRIIRTQSEHFSFYCYRQEVPYANLLAPALEDAYTRAADYLGVSNAGDISVVVYPNAQEMAAATGLTLQNGEPTVALLDEKLHLCFTADTAAQERQAVYQAVRQMVRNTIDTQETYLLTDGFAAFVAQSTADTPYYTGGEAGGAPIPSALTDAKGSGALYTAFTARADARHATLYAAFLANEEEGTALLKTLRGGSPCRFKRATGYEEAHWDALWKAWLAQPEAYSSEP